MNSKVIIPILIWLLIFILITCTLFVLVQLNFFDKFLNKNNSYEIISENLNYLSDAQQDKHYNQIDNNKITNKENQSQDTAIAETHKSNSKISIVYKSDSNNDKDSYKNISTKKRYAKGSTLPDVNFDSQGEYISQEEYNYRISLIKNLIIKTVVIDKLTKGNGISQEFYKVVYKEKMIPAKILEEIVESKEFRNLIPAPYRNLENNTSFLKKGDKVTFKNKDIKELLILWSLGRLTPVQKAWEVKAEK